MNDIIRQLDEHGYIEGYGDSSDYLYVKISRKDIEKIEYFVNHSGWYNYNDLYFYAENHEDTMSEEDLKLLHTCSDDGLDMLSTLERISWRIPD